jgi:hypothetical protein
MRGSGVPAHATPPAPTLASVRHGRIYWQGSAGAKDYSIESAPGANGPWKTICSRCVTDTDNGFAVASGAWHRVVPYNLDGRRGPASKPTR